MTTPPGGPAPTTLLTTVARSRTARTMARHRLEVQALIDCLAWSFGLAFATAVRFDFAFAQINWNGLAVGIVIASVLQIVSGLGFGLYTGRWRFGGFEEVAALARAVAVTCVGLFVVNASSPGPQWLPRSAPLAGAATALVVQASARYVWRLVLERARRPRQEGRKRLIVLGGGEGGLQVLTAIMRDPDSPWFPVALLDDDVAKRSLRLFGVPVMGGRRDLVEVAAKTKARAVLVAIPSADSALIASITAEAAGVGLQVMVLPSVGELFGSAPGVADIRPVTEADLLGRHQVETDIEAIAGYLTGKKVLVTGAGGSIGSELCRQIDRFGPAELIMVDHDESALHAVQLSMTGRALLDDDSLVLASIRDAQVIKAIFADRAPDVVFHAAALKHLAFLERYPEEAAKTNVAGTLNVLEAARDAGVTRFVNISTDKAANPTSVLGRTKQRAEQLTAAMAAEADGTYLSVRFGNVLGSRGSVLNIFRAQVEAGGPITVTHPDVTRYFMTVPEAVQLVIQAGAIGRDGEVLILDMGDPVRIDDVARRMAASVDPPVEIVYTGLRPGEKLHEDLFGDGEPDERPVHPLVSHVALVADRQAT